MLQVAVRMRSILGEGPCWDERSGHLYWIDILGPYIHRFDPSDGSVKTWSTGQAIGCLALRESSGLVCAMEQGIYSFDPERGAFARLIGRPDADLANNRFNDGKCDPNGRFIAGTMSQDENEGHGDKTPAGTLFRVNPDWSVKALLKNVSISNGLAWSSDGRTLYFIDSPTRQVRAFDYDPKAGEIGKQRVAVDFHKESGIPDGMTIDAEGRLWIAHWAGWRVSCWNPVSGEKLEEIMLPCQNVTCCAFGGCDLTDLYITTAVIGLDQDQQASQPDAGSLFCIKTQVPGLAPHRFAG